jgi:hypothetical protein
MDFAYGAAGWIHANLMQQLRLDVPPLWALRG